MWSPSTWEATIENLLQARRKILDLVRDQKPNLVVIGGGPAALEMSGNLWRLVNDQRADARITVLAGSKMLARFPEKLRRMAVKSLVDRGMEVVEDVRVDRLESREAKLTDGRGVPFDLALVAWGIKPASLFQESGLPAGEDGGLLVNQYLQGVEHPEIFGGGDCISFQGRPLDKVGVYAVRQNPVLYHNLMAMLEGQELRPFDPGAQYLLIFNLGDGTAIFHKKNWLWKGRLAFVWKDFLDRRFMRKFQVSGEREGGSLEA
jgi:NADH dehydrogenase FAD-containing subunit